MFLKFACFKRSRGEKNGRYLQREQKQKTLYLGKLIFLKYSVMPENADRFFYLLPCCKCL